MKIKPILIALFVGLLFSACSMVKNQSASTNFKRVKYRANLNFPKVKAEKKLTVTAFEASKTQAQEAVKPIANEARMASKSFHQMEKEEFRPTAIAARKLSYSPQHEHQQNRLLQHAKQLSRQMEARPTVTNDPWWESDPEEWPWKEILLATIVVLLIILAVYLLVSFLGGVVGGIIGLILLLALLYLLFDYYG